MDATPQLEALLAEAARPGSGVQIVGEMFREAKSGVRSTVEAVLEHAQVEGLPKGTEAPATPPNAEPWGKKVPEPKPSWTRQNGMKLELESWLGEDGKTLAVTLGLDLGPAPPVMPREGDRPLEASSPPAGKNDGTKTETADTPPAPALRKASFSTGISMLSGSTKLIGITQPIGQSAELKESGKDILWAAFLTGRARRSQSQPRGIATPGMAREKLPPGLREVAFQVPEGLLETLIPSAPFFSPPPSLKQWLQWRDITFPAGASIEHRDGLLQVVNTPENIETISALVDHAWAKAPHSVAFTLHTFEVSATLVRPLLQQDTAAENADDSALLAAVEAATARGGARAVSSAFFEGTSGTRTRHDSGLEQSLLTRFGTTPTAGQSELGFQRQAMGTVLEIEPTVSASGRTLDLVCTHDLRPASPASQREHLRAAGALMDHDLPGAGMQVLRTATATTMASGTTRLLSLCRPSLGARAGDPFGIPDMLWATFLQAHVVPQVRKPRPPPPPPKETPLTQEQADIRRIIDKMNTIIIPEVAFQGATRAQALEFLRVKSRELDTSAAADGEKGVKIVVHEDDFTGAPGIALDLKDVPLSEALHYVTELSQSTYRVKADGVLVMHHHTVADDLHTRTYRVGRDFLSIGDPSPAPALDDRPADPFSPAPAADTGASGRKTRKTAKQILESQGITFPEGASASYIASSGKLVVRNSQPNLDLIEAFCDCRCVRPVTSVGITAQVLQGPGPLLRRMAAQAGPLNDHRAMLDELLAAIKTGTVQALDTARIETKSGTRATTEQGRDGAALTGLALDGKGGSALKHAPLFSGLRLEMEPILGTDGVCVGLTVDAEIHTAAPLLRPEHLIDDQGRRVDFTLTDTCRARLSTALNILDGSTRLLHLWKPTGRPEFEKEDILQVMFITCDVLREHTNE